VPEFCGQRSPMPISGAGVDLNGDGAHELITLGDQHVVLHHFRPQRRSIDLLATLAPEDAGRTCKAGAVLSLDFNYDGRVDVMIGCQVHRGLAGDAQMFNLIFLQDESGTLRLADWPREPGQITGDWGSSLALGGLDIDRDGLLDVLIAEDYGGAAWIVDRKEDIPPGRVWRACPPDANCRYEPWFLHPDPALAIGSFMGFGNLTVQGRGEHLLVSDIGANRVVQFVAGEAVDRATEFGLENAYLDGEPQVSWSLLVEDWDRDGDDDFLLSNGSIFDLPIHSNPDRLYLQEEGGRFIALGGEVGLHPHGSTDSHREGRIWAGRGAAQADIDGDGALDVIQAGMEGVMRVYREVPNADDPGPRCTLIPRPTVSPTFGLGYTLWFGDQPRRRAIQGQTRIGASPWLVSEHSSGVLEFPSGQRSSFDCQGGAGPIWVDEITTLSVRRDGSVLRLRSEQLALTRAVIRNASGARRTIEAADGLDGSSLEDSDRAIMVGSAERWLPRWWALTP
jgi:hypothetical protein